MANTITKQTLLNGPRNLVVKINISGDGSGEESATSLIDVSAYDASEVVIESIKAALNGFVMELLWDATANVPIVEIPDYEYNLNGHQIGSAGGLWNNAGTGKTGDILFSTTGLGAGDKGSVILKMRKK